MNHMEFDFQMERLKSAYGEKNFSEERIEIIWSIVKDLHGFQFRNVVTTMLAQERFAPMPVTIEEAAKKYKRALNDKAISTFEDQLAIDNYLCEQCNNKGFLLAANQEEHEMPYAFLCDKGCRAAVFHNFKFPMWSKKYGTKYKLEG